MKFPRIASAFLILALSMQAAVAADKPAPAVNASDKDSFAAVSAWVRTQMEDGGRYAETKASEQVIVNTRLDEMAAMFAAKGSVDQMSADEKVKLFDWQEQVNSILGKRDGERLICRRERPIGSNVPVRICETAREIEQRRRMDQKEIQRQQVNKQKQWG